MAGSIFRRRYFFLLLGAGLRVLNHGKTVRPAQLIIEFPQDAQRGPFNITEFTVTVEIGAVKEPLIKGPSNAICNRNWG